MTRRAFVVWLLGLLAWGAALVVGFLELMERMGRSSRLLDGGARSQAADGARAEQREPRQEAEAVPLFAFMVLSDLHISKHDPGTIRHLKQALTDIEQMDTRVGAIALTGDLTEYGTDEEYGELRKLLAAYKLPPVYANMGNHDYYHVWLDRSGQFNPKTMPHGKTDWQSRERFQQFFGLKKPYHDAWVNGHHLIALSQETYVQERPEVGEGAWYSEEQLRWLEQQLAPHKDGSPVFILTHQPLPPAGQDGKSHQLIPAQRLRAILKPYKNVFVFCGHRHQDFAGKGEHYVKEGFHYFHNSSVGRVLNEKYEHVAKEKAQGMYVEVFADRVRLRGREFASRKWVKEADWTVPFA
ncbi:metallophosphoesterase [Paenibacillus sp. YYML68]|uniref:metallophosphoesterase family protein n=1 Tax=Paenibacillus sp. YYML68 TaxID=2909250 RepID=UPI0024922979|nr:metallophosphoesterase [Paenibacillus sp. YYML68]